MKLERIQPGQYWVDSETTAGRRYKVLLDMVEFQGGTCNCQGYEAAHRAGHQCKHIRECIAEEMEWQNGRRG